MNRPFDMTACWKRIVAMARRDADILFIFAGLFTSVPVLAMIILLLPALPDVAGMDAAQVGEAVNTFVVAHWPGLLLFNLALGFAPVLIWDMLLAGDRPTVGVVLKRSLTSFLYYLPLYIVLGLVVQIGLRLYILPGIFIMARFIAAGPVMLAEREHNALLAVRRAWRLSAGQSLKLMLFVMVLGLVAGIVLLLVTGLLMSIAALALPVAAARIFDNVVIALLAGVVQLFYALVAAAIYRSLAETKATD